MNNPLISHSNLSKIILPIIIAVLMFILICVLANRLEYYMNEVDRLSKVNKELEYELDNDKYIIDRLDDTIQSHKRTIEELNTTIHEQIETIDEANNFNNQLMSKRYFETDFVASVNNFIDCLCQAYPIVDPYIVRSIVYHESRYNPDSSNGNCVGLTQLSTKWFSKRAEEIDLTDLQEPFSNLLVCVRYLNELLKDMTIEDALYEYNHSKIYVDTITLTANRMRTEVESNGSEATSP